MKKLVAVLALVLLASLLAAGQEKASMFGGWQYTHVGDGGSGLGGVNVPKGFDFDIAANLRKNVAIVGDFSSAFKSESATVSGVTGTATARTYSFLFGPRFVAKSGKLSPFAETLIGVAHSSASASVNGLGSVGSGSSNNFAFALGGGLDVAASKNISVRLAKFDYEFVKADGAHLNNFRYATGIVFKF